VIQELKERLDSDIYLVKWWDLAIDEIKKTTEPPFFYACDKEISAYVLGQRVDHGKLKAEVRILKPKFVKHDFLVGGPKVYAATPPMTTLGGTGSVGDSFKAAKEKGEKTLFCIRQ
jgi:creatinine amidohydrolase/Fe(II)-dependent formamide hydrolase-like protein